LSNVFLMITAEASQMTNYIQKRKKADNEQSLLINI